MLTKVRTYVANGETKMAKKNEITRIIDTKFFFGGMETNVTSTIVIESPADWNGYAIVHHRLSDGTFMYSFGKVTNGAFFSLLTDRIGKNAYNRLHCLGR
jgi:hypothetical protein